MDDCVRRLRVDARQPHRRDRARDRADALLPPRVRLPRHRAPRASPPYADAFAERQLTLLEEMPRGPLPAYGDSDRLARAISQLLDNAVQVHARRAAPSACACACSRRTTSCSWPTAGPGVPPERAERVFDPFYQVDGSPTRAHGGVGVGLAIARRVARGLGRRRASSPGGATVEGDVPRRARRSRSPSQARAHRWCVDAAQLSARRERSSRA